MMLNEATSVPASALPVAAFRDHLRLGTGFSDLGAEDAALVAYLRAAIAAIEARTAKVLLSREYVLTLERWGDPREQPLPLAPVGQVVEARLRDPAGAATVIAPARYRLVPDSARPRIAGLGGDLPRPVEGGRIEIVFVAGFGAGWDDLPADLGHAVMLLAAQYYELRHDGAGEAAAMPFGVLALIERWRIVRMLGGRGGRA